MQKRLAGELLPRFQNVTIARLRQHHSVVVVKLRIKLNSKGREGPSTHNKAVGQHHNRFRDSVKRTFNQIIVINIYMKDISNRCGMHAMQVKLSI